MTSLSFGACTCFTFRYLGLSSFFRRPRDRFDGFRILAFLMLNPQAFAFPKGTIGERPP